MENQKEKIISLNEDSKKHEHDDSSFEKLLQDQKIKQKEINDKNEILLKSLSKPY